MNGKTLLIVLVTGLLTFASGWLLHNVINMKSEAATVKLSDHSKNTIPGANTTKTNNPENFSPAILGRFIMKGANCAGFNFINKNIVLWTNEITCNEADTLKISWIDKAIFMTRSTESINESCPPRVNIYSVISFENDHLVLKSIWTGWNDFKDEQLHLIKQ